MIVCPTLRVQTTNPFLRNFTRNMIVFCFKIYAYAREIMSLNQPLFWFKASPNDSNLISTNTVKGPNDFDNIFFKTLRFTEVKKTVNINIRDKCIQKVWRSLNYLGYQLKKIQPSYYYTTLNLRTFIQCLFGKV